MWFTVLKVRIKELRQDAIKYYEMRIGKQIVEKMNELMDNCTLADMSHFRCWYRKHGGSEDNLA